MSMFTEGGQIIEFYLVNVSTVWVESIHNICILIRMICATSINISWIFFNFHFSPSPEITFLAISLSLKVHSVAYALSSIWGYMVSHWTDKTFRSTVTYCDILDAYVQTWTPELKASSNVNPLEGIRKSLLGHLKSIISVLNRLIHSP